MNASGMSFDEFADGLRTLQGAGAILISAAPNGEQVISLTPAGKQLAQAQAGHF